MVLWTVFVGDLWDQQYSNKNKANQSYFFQIINCTYETNSTMQVNKSQVGFIQFMITPFFSSFCSFLKSKGNNASVREREGLVARETGDL